MHALQSKHTRITDDEVAKLVSKYNVSISQLPKISQKDASLPEGCIKGDVIKVERADEVYFRVVV